MVVCLNIAHIAVKNWITQMYDELKRLIWELHEELLKVFPYHIALGITEERLVRWIDEILK